MLYSLLSFRIWSLDRLSLFHVAAPYRMKLRFGRCLVMAVPYCSLSLWFWPALNAVGMDWIPFLIVGFIIGLIYKAVVPDKQPETEKAA